MSEWITDRLPPDDHFKVWCAYDRPYSVIVVQAEGYRVRSWILHGNDVIAWQPIVEPEPPDDYTIMRLPNERMDY